MSNFKMLINVYTLKSNIYCFRKICLKIEKKKKFLIN